MTITGKLYEIYDEMVKSNDFKTREFILETSENPSYPQYIKLALTKDKTELLDAYQKNEYVTVHFNIKGNKWINPQGIVTYINSLEAWKLESLKVVKNDTKEIEKQE